MGSSSAGRLSFIDYLRGIAVLWMIEVHVIDICLRPELKTGSFFEILDISNGFVAVAFIFCAGIGFQLAFDKKEQDYRSFSSPLWLYLRRLGHILLLAYWLHLPAFSLGRLLGASPQEFRLFADCDVLQTIVFSSLIALILSLLISSARMRTAVTALVALGCFFGASLVLPMHLFDQSPSVFSALLSGVPVSKFPLIPYTGFFFSGMFCIRLFMQSNSRDRSAWILLGASLILYTVVLLLRGSAYDLPGSSDWWHLSAGHAFFRLSVVVVVLMALYLSRDIVAKTPFANMLVVCGQESLFMYIFHLFVVYGYIGNYSLLGWAQHGWGWAENVLCYLIIAGITYVLCLAWHRLKKNNPQRASMMIRVAVTAGLILFCAVPASLTLPK